MKNELDKIPDWRLHATSYLKEDWNNPWTGKNVAKGTRITVVSVIQLAKDKTLTIPHPNATALLLNSAANSFKIAKSIRTKSKIDKSIKHEVVFLSESEAFDYIERVIESIILAFTALEAFVNESIPDDFIYSHHHKSNIILETKEKQAIERNISIDEKLSSVLPEALKCPSPKTSRCWSDYKELKKIRDRVIHMKTVDRKSSLANVDTVWKRIFQIPAPHQTIKSVIDFFVPYMKNKPGWHDKFPHSKA